MTDDGRRGNSDPLSRLHRAFNERDAETALGLLAGDVVWHVPGNHPISGTYRGRQAVWEGYIGRFWSGPARIEDHGALSHPDHAHVAVLHTVVRDMGEGELRLGGIEVATIRNGQIAERWEFEEDQELVDRFMNRAGTERDPA